jgi:serine/threonine protein kinase
MSSELRVGNKYRLGRKIGSGSFGDIYLGARSSSLLLLRLAGRLALLSELRAVAVAVALRCRASCLHFEA